MKHEQKLTSLQVGALIVGGVIGIFTLTMPTQVIDQAGNDAWLSVLIGGSAMVMMTLMLLRLSLYYKDETVIEYLPKIYGKLLGNVFNIVLIIYLAMTVSFLSRYFSDLARMALLPNTPRWAILLLFWLVVAYWAQFGIRVIAITMTIILIPTFLNVGGFVFIPLERVKFPHLLPILAEGWAPVFSGAFRSIFFYFGIASLAFIIPVVKEPKKIYKAALSGFVIVIGVFTLLLVILIARFSTEEVNNMVFPVVTLMRTLQVPGAFLERTDIIFFAIFIATSLDDAALYLYLSVLGTVRLTRKRYYKLYVLIIGAVSYGFALIHLDPVQVDVVIRYFKYLGLFYIGFVFPVALLITAIKQRRQSV